MNATSLRVGTLVLITLVLTACRGGSPPVPRRLVDLSPALTPDVSQRRLGARVLEFLGSQGGTSVQTIVPPEAALAYGVQQICVFSQAGAYLDAPARLLRGGEDPAQVGLERLMGPARIADLRWHDRESPLQITDLEVTPIEPGDVLILFLGYEPPQAEHWPRYAPLSAQASEWLVAKGIRALATDVPAITRHSDIAERLQSKRTPEEVWAEHIPFFQAQIPVIAGLVNLESIVDERSVFFVGLPLAVAGATGAPVRAVAVVY